MEAHGSNPAGPVGGAPPPTGERRAGADRRGGDRRRAPGRRAEDIRHARLEFLWVTFWAVVGALVVLYLFFVVIGSIDPQDNKVLAGIVLAMAVGWLAHAWRRIWKGGYSTHTERERRGF